MANHIPRLDPLRSGDASDIAVATGRLERSREGAAEVAIGIDIGSVTLSAAVVAEDGEGIRVLDRRAVPHDGQPLRLLGHWWREWGGLYQRAAVATTGQAAVRRLPWERLDAVRTVEAGLALLGLELADRTVVSAGGEMMLAYRLDGDGRIRSVNSGNKCASGTGAFFRQQIRRMGVDLDAALALAAQGEPLVLSRRCSVFCKSDCTHALNTGRSKADVIAGLCEVIAGKIRELAAGSAHDLVLIGGCGRNRGVIARLEESLDTGLVVPPWPDAVEALGAAALALRRCPMQPLCEAFALGPEPDFPRLPALEHAAAMVTFCEEPLPTPRADADCLIGLDVGSTTTKAVLMERSSGEVWSRVYLRTDGDPVAASRACYRALAAEAPAGTRVVAVGTTGSGRVVAGLHAGASAVVNEILAHARAAARFDPEVDTIFEIGGQDAKYTHLVGGVPADSAMNEACSAGTGSFLEEAAREAFGLAAEDIAERAIAGRRPARFSEQCAAFIGSDVATAVDQGLATEDILAGLVYGVCRNYLNKVRGGRPVGRKVLIQGGVCYNRAVPLAMAALAGRPLVVPPDPGLMGAVGVALELRDRLDNGLATAGSFDLHDLAERSCRTLGTRSCRGGSGKDACDYRCSLLSVEVAGKRQVVGGLCGRYENAATRRDPAKAVALDGVSARSSVIFASDHGRTQEVDDRPTIGLNRSFMTHAFLPYFHAFFAHVGWRTVLPDVASPEGMARQGAAFCHPFAQAHGYFQDLVARDPDRFFLPHMSQLPYGSNNGSRRTCVFVQGESYALRSAFPEIAQERILSPVLPLQDGWDGALPALEGLAAGLQVDVAAIRKAHRAGLAAQMEAQQQVRQIGERLLAEVARSQAGFGIVIFGRPYNALSMIGNMGIPRTLAGEGIPVISYDALPMDEGDDPQAYWANGQMLLRAARTVARNPDLYGLFISNFSCGPDSFLVTRWRDVLAGQPTLTIEIDGHTASAGVRTRLDAFLDVIRCRRRAAATTVTVPVPSHPARLPHDRVELADGGSVAIDDPAVTVWLPRMGDLGTEALAATLRASGLPTRILPAPDDETLQAGRAAACGKECLPFHLTMGAFIQQLQRTSRDDAAIDLFFMPTSDGPCRQGQYAVMVQRQLSRMHHGHRSGVLSLSDQNVYAGTGMRGRLHVWRGICIADMMEDVQHALAVLADDPAAALAAFQAEWQALVTCMEGGSGSALMRRLKQACRRLQSLPLRQTPDQAPRVTLVGEIFVRKDELSRSGLVEKLRERGVLLRVAATNEYFHYAAWMSRHHGDVPLGLMARMGARLADLIQTRIQERIYCVITQSGLLTVHDPHIDDTIDLARPHLDPCLPGEAILTIGSTIDALHRTSHGVIALGPFGCMPNRLAQAILGRFTEHHPHGPLPFLALETDGGPLSPLVEARIDAFILQVERRHRRQQSAPAEAADRTAAI